MISMKFFKSYLEEFKSNKLFHTFTVSYIIPCVFLRRFNAFSKKLECQ